MIYFAPILLLYLASIVKMNKYVLKLILVFFGAFLTTTYFNGSDWRMYEKVFFIPEWEERFIKQGEYVFLIYIRVGRFIFDNFILFLIASKIASFYIIDKSIERLFPDRYRFYLLFYPIIGLYLFIDNPFRQMITFSIFMWSLKYIIDREFFKFAIIIIVGILVHKSLAIVFPMFFFYNRIKLSKGVLVLLMLAVLLVISNSFLFESIFSLGMFVPYFGLKIEAYINSSDYGINSNMLSFGALEKMLVFALMIKYRNRLVSSIHIGELVWNGAYIAILFYLFALRFEILGRIALYFYPFYILLIVLLVHIIKNRQFKQILLIFLLLYSSILTYKAINSKSVYLPYTSYPLYWLEGDGDLDYKVRDNYHLK